MNNNFDLEKFLQDNQCPVCKLPLSVSKSFERVQYSCSPLNVVCHYTLGLYYTGNDALSINETILYPDKTRSSYDGYDTVIISPNFNYDKPTIIDGRLDYQSDLKLFIKNYNIL